MKKSTLKTRLWALAATLLLLVSLLAMPVSAVNGGTKTFNKYLILNENAHVPDAEFTFTITPGDAVPANPEKKMPAIYAGIGQPTVTKAEFTPDDTATTDVKDNEVTLEPGEAFAKKAVTVDFSGVDFTAPGIYRYTITEDDPTSQSGVAIEGNSTRTLDVYVEYTDDEATTLDVTHYVLQDGTGNPNTAAKSKGFTNTYTTYNLTLTKDVTGNQGNRDKYFRFEVTIANAVAGTKYTVTVPEGLSQNDLEGNDQMNDVNKAELEATGGTVTAIYYLKDGQSITIQGLTPATTYAISEASYAADGYTTKYQIDSNGEQTANSFTAQTMGDTSHTVTFTNDKEGTVPTGILLETAPYLILGAVVVAGLVVLFATRRRRSRE